MPRTVITPGLTSGARLMCARAYSPGAEPVFARRMAPATSASVC